MLQAVLFDLDDTLLGNNMRSFLGNYLPMLAAFVEPVIERDRFLPELMIATQAVIANQDRSHINLDVFWSVFCERTGLDRVEMEPLTDRFYQERFGQLQPVTCRRPSASKLVQFCLDRGLKAVIATNPLFPRSAIEQRLAWAGVPVTDYDYELVTCLENMHSAKPNTAYYEEILARIDVQPNEALMVGDDLENDIRPARQIGLLTFWINQRSGESEPMAVEQAGGMDDSGSLDMVLGKLAAGWMLD